MARQTTTASMTRSVCTAKRVICKQQLQPQNTNKSALRFKQLQQQISDVPCNCKSMYVCVCGTATLPFSSLKLVLYSCCCFCCRCLPRIHCFPYLLLLLFYWFSCKCIIIRSHNLCYYCCCCCCYYYVFTFLIIRTGRCRFLFSCWGAGVFSNRIRLDGCG